MATTGKLEIPPIRIGKATLLIEGVTLLCIHKFSEKARQIMLDKHMGKPTTLRENKVPAQDFMRCLYVLPGSTPILHDEDPENVWAEGRFGIKAISFKNAAVRAATSAGAKMTETRMAIQIGASLASDELIEIHCEPGPKMRQDVVRNDSGVPDIRFRPEFWPWAVELPVTYNKSMVSLAQVVSLFHLAGFGVGIAEGRPSGKESSG